ncbi:hypothetical protein [Streptomyces sp. NPDC047097]|uniref:hypothetical protein n=1 Tax=Streptomyces sp. NPDC047097 TaxID=3155260 RepID=UPI0033FE83F2
MKINEARRIHNKFYPKIYQGGYRGVLVTPTHPLEGRSVSRWVAEARKGWPKVPIPSDPDDAARKVLERHAEDDVLFERI